MAKRAERSGIQVFRHLRAQEDPLSPPTRPEVMYFRRGFWLETSRRFSALAAFHLSTGGPIIHVESDVTLFPNFPMATFARLSSRIAFPLADAGHGIGSVVYLANPEVSESLARHMTGMREGDRQLPDPTGVNDMTRLADFAMSADGVLVLPTAPSGRDVDGSPDFAHAVASRRQEFGGIFDALSIGQYLTGTDPRNHRGLRVLGQYSFEGIRPEAWSFRSADELLWVRERESGTEYPVFNLHVHSKDLRMFDPRSRGKLLEQRCSSQAKMPTREIDLWGLGHSLAGLGTRVGTRVRSGLRR